MTFSSHFLILITGVSLVLSACLGEEPLNDLNTGVNADTVELKEYDTIVAFEDETTGEEMRNLIRQGGVPDFMKNQISLGVNETGHAAIPDKIPCLP